MDGKPLDRYSMMFNPPPGTNGFITSERLKVLRWNFKAVNKIYLVTFQVKTRLLCSFCAFVNDLFRSLNRICRPKFWQFKANCNFLKLETCRGNGTFQSKVSLTKETY